MPVSKYDLEAGKAIQWNQKYGRGKWVRVLRDDGVKFITKTRSFAATEARGRAVVWVEGSGEAVPLDRVTALDTVKAVADA